MTVHFIYVTGDQIAAPFSITRELGTRLAEKFEVKTYSWEDTGTIIPEPGDILLGHPFPEPGRIYRNSFFSSGWAKRIVICPFAHAMPEYIAFLDDLVMQADRYLALCGEYWIDSIHESLFTHWNERMTRLDLAVNRSHYPPIKSHFNEIQKRSFLYIGRTGLNKGTDYLESLAKANPTLRFGWAGSGEPLHRAITPHGPLDFRTDHARNIVAQYDFIISCGRSDANPATILEGASWGLIPVGTPQCGYYNKPWIVPIPLDNIPGASQVLRSLNAAPQAELELIRKSAEVPLKTAYTWEKFANTVIDELVAPPRVYPEPTLEITSHQKILAAISAKEHSRQRRVRYALHIKGVLRKVLNRLLAKKSPQPVGAP